MKYASQIPRETIARLEAMAAEDPVRFCQPHPCPGVYSSREDEEFWCYKCWGHALEQPCPDLTSRSFSGSRICSSRCRRLPRGAAHHRQPRLGLYGSRLHLRCVHAAPVRFHRGLLPDHRPADGKSGIDGLSRRALRPQPAEGPARPDQDRLQSAHEHVCRDAGPVCELPGSAISPRRITTAMTMTRLACSQRSTSLTAAARRIPVRTAVRRSRRRRSCWTSAACASRS